MADLITVTAIRRWMNLNFGNDRQYLPDYMRPKMQEFKSLYLRGLHIPHLAQYLYASKAVLVARKRPTVSLEDHFFVWAILYKEMHEIKFIETKGTTRGISEVQADDLPKFELEPLFKKNFATIKAFLYFLFLDLGTVDHINCYNGFYNDLEDGFRLHLNEKKRLTKRMRDENTTHDQEPQAKRREWDHMCPSVHEQLATEYAKNLKECNQLRRDKEAFDASTAQLKLDLEDAQKWKAKCKKAEAELQLEKDKAMEFAQKLAAKEEAETIAVEKQARELTAYAAKKRADLAMK